jgi:hypothetical protein
MTKQEKANPRPTRKTGVWGTRQPKNQEEERFLASLGMTIVFCDGLFGMTNGCDCAEKGRSSAALLRRKTQEHSQEWLCHEKQEPTGMPPLPDQE